MNWWPWVSRERFEERGIELDRLRTELGDERLYSRKLWNHLQWLTTGRAFDTTQLPEAYQPRTSVTTGHDEDADKPAMQVARAPKQARRDIALFEVRQQNELDRRSGKPQRPPHVAKEQAEMAARLSKTVDDAQAAGN